MDIALSPKISPGLALYSIPEISCEYRKGVPTTEETISFGRAWSEKPTFWYAEPLSRTRTGVVSTKMKKWQENLDINLFKIACYIPNASYM